MEVKGKRSMLLCIVHLHTVLYQPIRSLILLFSDGLFINIVGLYLGGRTSTTCPHKEPLTVDRDVGGLKKILQPRRDGGAT